MADERRSRLGTILLIVVVAGGAAAARHYGAKPLHASVNAPGAKVELARLLTPGKTNVVYLYADW